MSESILLPNSTQLPNLYVDQLLHLLTGDELKVLIYAVRRIFGFRKTVDHITMQQFASGTVHRGDGYHLDHGTGLSENRCRSVVRGLVALGILRVVDENEGRQEGPSYELQLDPKQIDWEALARRKEDAAAAGKARIEKARQARNAPVLSHETRPAPQNPSCPTEGVLSDRVPTPPVPQKGSSFIGNPAKETKSTAADEPPPPKKKRAPDVHPDTDPTYERFVKLIGCSKDTRLVPNKAALKQMLVEGHAPDDIIDCCKWLKQAYRWRNSYLTLTAVRAEIIWWRDHGRPHIYDENRNARRAPAPADLPVIEDDLTRAWRARDAERDRLLDQGPPPRPGRTGGAGA